MQMKGPWHLSCQNLVECRTDASNTAQVARSRRILEIGASLKLTLVVSKPANGTHVVQNFEMKSLQLCTKLRIVEPRTNQHKGINSREGHSHAPSHHVSWWLMR